MSVSGLHEDLVPVPPAGRYTIEPDRCVLSLSTTHLFGLGRVRGTSRLRGGELNIADPLEGSTVQATVDAGSFHTGNAKRDADVVSARLLDVGAFPEITFVSERFEQAAGGGGWLVHGLLCAHGCDRPVVLQVDRVRASSTEVRVHATLTIDRYEFGITAAKGMAGRRLQLDLDVVAVRG